MEPLGRLPVKQVPQWDDKVPERSCGCRLGGAAGPQAKGLCLQPPGAWGQAAGATLRLSSLPTLPAPQECLSPAAVRWLGFSPLPTFPPRHTHRARGTCRTKEDGVCSARSCSGQVPPRQACRPAPPCSGRGRRQHLPEVVWRFKRTWGQDEQLTFTAASRTIPGRTTTTLLSAKHLRECRPHRERAVYTGRELST